MHLFAAKPGGFVDDEGIVDLQQSPAEIIILSAADSSLSALAQAVERLAATLDDAYPTVRLANWMNLVKPAAYDLYEDRVLEEARLVIVSLMGGSAYWKYGHERLLAWAAAGQGRQLILVPGCDAPDDALLEDSSVPFESAHRVWRYLREGGVDNAEQLLRFVGAECLKQRLEVALDWQEPKAIPAALLYASDAVGRQIPERPVCLLLFYRSHLQGANTAVLDGLIEALRAQGLEPLAVAVASLKEESCVAFVNHLIEQTGAMLVVNTTGFSVNRNPDDMDALDVPDSLFVGRPVVLQAILASSAEEDWQAMAAGLHSRDVAMQVVLPEMDGRVITRAVGFKTEAHYSERCQLSVTRHALHPERAAFVAKLARRFCRLRQTPNAAKRLALVLANYPNRDGRIGNGVGLDTPASTVRILRALSEAGYPVNDVPDDGDALIRLLQGTVTNDHRVLDQRGCWQSIGLDDYLEWFQTLPAPLQEAVWTRWGAPSDDPKCRQGRLMIAGIRLGETFVGIQPERDFSDDPTQTYHDTELVPPHSYLAFYLWLRDHYRVDAVVHVGKHGNLEWLPGKSTALSADCWPDIALGPLPHFYPFIVNDPGEGAQAKRRSQAVIIDHLMPPLARAELYGAMAELEALTDEYYQALGMDPRREALLRERILEHLRRTGIDQELAHGGDSCAESADSLDDDLLLNELDTYLCDIKEAQIRHGLHVLGTLPPQDKLAGTLVAILRLPRGEGPAHRGLLHNLADDLGLQEEGGHFDPLTAGAEPWTGPRPLALSELDDAAWRTAADTRERLELLAHRLMADYVLADDMLDESCLTELARDYPATAEQCRYARERLWAAMQRGAEMEIQSLLDGLGGVFVPAGPSGAPSRGRLDTLPTGRNFFSVDNRSIPSPAAWSLGEKSAQAFVERYLQDNGDYPRRLGLSIWGTATMRTGGDDIAQAFALMGVRPVWSLGSQRVIDVEVIPAMLLQRPRVDVTLRVSGFFRDAFPNVIRLFDAAVQAVAEYEEPGNGNTIRAAVLERRQELERQGLSPDAAAREAGYRVFGSKPGEYGTGLNRLIDNRAWDTADDLAEAYLGAGAYAYGQFPESGIAARRAFERQLEGLEAVMQNQDNREHDILDSNSYYEFQGGMANASRSLGGQAPIIYHADHANPAHPRIRTLKEELARVIRSRVLNPKWIEAMREHGYKGAFEMAATVDYLFAYDATTDLVADYQYAQVSEALVLDPVNQQFLREHNPAALEEMAERLLEAVQRGMWQDPSQQGPDLQDLLLQIDEAKETGSP
ncbi:cobaltochelatase subunit CobN [Litchfieldella anticariensis FP35 = DSM 16096]|uniref:Cobaltochelatase subunit CobN n=1 Tax=Litchfieldella anticariensis (strain DSM 16096 / CECT 5854 / CIP 108499 / LMG 22089 / FP35) TaxID=1121939 RepID=S2L3W2_LITA3|nr:cobaltochelatase subunit CobN [Halomonas anticariensis]EPC02399.1 cobaltochelatase subunit CobN [Halomonas anticariensis FP35 = DSM 16096]